MPNGRHNSKEFKVIDPIDKKYNVDSKAITLANNDILFTKGDSGERLFLILAGNIRIFRLENGIETTLTDMKAGEVVGTLSILKNSKRTASAKAIGITKVREFDAKGLTTMMENEIPKWYQSILKDVILRFMELEDKYMKLQNRKS